MLNLFPLDHDIMITTTATTKIYDKLFIIKGKHFKSVIFSTRKN